MNEFHPGKRQRTEEPVNFNATKIDIWKALTHLDASFTQQMLFRIAMSQPRVASEIWEFYQFEMQKERTKILDFGIHADDVEAALDQEFKQSYGSESFQDVHGVTEQILRAITAIQEEATKPYASFGTRRSGLETLRTIGDIICTSNGHISRQVVEQFGYETALEDAMLAIVGCMTVDQRSAMARDGDGKSEFREKMRDLIALANGCNAFVGLSDVLSELEGQRTMSGSAQEDLRETVAQTRETQPHVRDYYAKLQNNFVPNGTGIAAMNQFTASHNPQMHTSPQGANRPPMNKMPASHLPSNSHSNTPVSYTNPELYPPQNVPQNVPRNAPPNPHPANAYYSAPPYQPALGSLATRQYSATPPYQADTRYANQKYPPTAAPLASQAYPDQYWSNKPSYQPPPQQ